MPIIKLDAIASTNSYLKELCSRNKVEDLTTVLAKHQFEGRGQMGTTWQSELGKNLTCSVFKRFNGLSVDDSFYISIITSLAIIKALQKFNIPKLRIKWPNDILSEEKKICGILIENVIKNEQIDASIIGIGLNVNQSFFDELPNASSMKVISGKLFDIDEILQHILIALKGLFKKLDSQSFNSLTNSYESLLFRKDKPSTFKDDQGNIFPGFIKGIDTSGNLNILLEDDILESFGMKEIKLLF
jgi:BirA family biotin operon repressor/biotin-[acetyl-CoA-carboxylase] ligase